MRLSFYISFIWNAIINLASPRSIPHLCSVMICFDSSCVFLQPQTDKHYWHYVATWGQQLWKPLRFTVTQVFLSATCWWEVKWYKLVVNGDILFGPKKLTYCPSHILFCFSGPEFTVQRTWFISEASHGPTINWTSYWFQHKSESLPSIWAAAVQVAWEKKGGMNKNDPQKRWCADCWCLQQSGLDTFSSPVKPMKHDYTLCAELSPIGLVHLTTFFPERLLHFSPIENNWLGAPAKTISMPEEASWMLCRQANKSQIWSPAAQHLKDFANLYGKSPTDINYLKRRKNTQRFKM